MLGEAVIGEPPQAGQGELPYWPSFWRSPWRLEFPLKAESRPQLNQVLPAGTTGGRSKLTLRPRKSMPANDNSRCNANIQFDEINSAG